MDIKKQTAVECLFEKYKLIGMLTTAQVEKAKEMEKEQICNAYKEGAFEKMRHLDGKKFMMPNEYYNETYKSEE